MSCEPTSCEPTPSDPMPANSVAGRLWASWLVVALVGCSSAPRSPTWLLDPGVRGEKRLERLERRLEGRDPFEQLAELYGLPGRLRDEVGSGKAVPEAGAFSVETTGAVRAGAQDVCGAAFCAGVAERPLDPAFFDLPRLPRNGLLRRLSGVSRPPLAGYGGRLGRFPGLLLKLLFPRQYYSHLFKKNEGTLDASAVNSVKALVLVDAAGAKLVWVKTDLIGAFQDLRAQALRAAVERGVAGVHDGNFLLHGTHTHSGLGAVNPRGFFQVATIDLFSEPVFRAVVASVAATVAAADAGLVPARLAAGAGRLEGVTRNRRLTCEETGDPPNTDPDPEVGVLSIDRADGSPLATVIHFAVHGTSLPAENLLYSPDNMGYAERLVEEEIGGTALFFNGAEGDVAPVGSGTEGAKQVGEALGREALAVRSTLAPTDEIRLASSHCQIDDPEVAPDFPTPCPGRIDQFQLRPGKFLERSPGCFRDREGDGWVVRVKKRKDPPLVEREGVVMNAFRIDVGSGAGLERTVVMTLPGEPITDVGMEIKARARDDQGFDRAWLFSLANGHMAYVVTEKEYVEGGYEAGANVFGPSAGRIFTENALSLARELAETLSPR